MTRNRLAARGHRKGKIVSDLLTVGQTWGGLVASRADDAMDKGSGKPGACAYLAGHWKEQDYPYHRPFVFPFFSNAESGTLLFALSSITPMAQQKQKKKLRKTINMVE